jgi:hypothetical protein
MTDGGSVCEWGRGFQQIFVQFTVRQKFYSPGVSSTVVQQLFEKFTISKGIFVTDRRFGSSFSGRKAGTFFFFALV